MSEVKATAKSINEIINETESIYSDPKNRGLHDNGGCQYLTLDGKMCAVGRCMIKPSVDMYGTVSGYDEFDLLLKPEYCNHPIRFWIDIQNWHDDDSNFTETNISISGITNLKKIRDKWEAIANGLQ
jgi:hypothetical protein